MIDNNDDDDGSPQLSAETLKILQEWQQEQEKSEETSAPQEDWVSDFNSMNMFAAQISCLN